MTRPPLQGKAFTPGDAPAGNLVDRFAPAAIAPYLRLARADRPIGFFLLALPCFWSVALAGRSLGEPYPDLWLLFLFVIGAVVMRAAGCTYNDLIDRDIDAQVARTRSRPLPSGQVTPGAATIFMLALCLAGLIVLLSFNSTTIWLGFAVIPIVALYPFVKRFSHWPQAVLGFAFNWGALLGWTAVLGRLDWPAVVLYAGAVLWTVGYDTIYAHQDKADDALVGIRSSARRLGDATVPWLWAFYAITLALLALAAALNGAGLLFYPALALAALHFAWQIRTLDIDDPASCLRRFRSNRELGLLVFVAILAGHW